MARIRTIKPEFPQSETMGRLSRDARLLFIQLWTIVDDEGRARAASRMLASLLYPYDTDAVKLIDKWLSELEREGCIRRYEVGGSHYLDIPNWLKHQKIDRPSPSRLPAFEGDSTKPREASRSIDADLGPRTVDQDQVSRATERANDWPSDYREKFWSAYPKKVDKQAAFRKLERIWRADSVGWPLLLAAVRAYAQSVVGTEPKFIKSPEVWLNKGCWEDELPSAPKVFAAIPSGLIHVMRESPEWASWAEIYRQRKGKDPPIDKTGGWTFETSWASEAAE